jgi:hypothetical protein
MPPGDLVIIRDRVTGGFERLVNRVDALERVPILLEVLEEGDGNKTVVIDMRDGTTRRFQTRIDWLDTADTLSDPPVSSEVLELRDRLHDQTLLTQSESRLARDYEKQVSGLQELLSTAERDLSDMRERSSALAEEERRARSESAEVAEEKIRLLIEERDEWKQRWATASKVIDESLPSIADLLSEGSAENAKLRAELEELR